MRRFFQWAKKLTRELYIQYVLKPTAWFDATETYAKSKIAVDLQNTRGAAAVDYLENIEGIAEVTELCVEFVFEQQGETQVSEISVEIVMEEV